MKRIIITAISTAALLFGAITPTFASTTIQISGNGAGSTNHITVNSSNVNLVSQNNLASISNNVNSSGNTGGNNSNWNTGGNVTIRTRNSVSNVSVTTHANVNFASIGCGCISGKCK